MDDALQFPVDVADEAKPLALYRCSYCSLGERTIAASNAEEAKALYLRYHGILSLDKPVIAVLEVATP